MNKTLLKLESLCLLLLLSLPMMGQNNVVAQWDFQNDIPAGIQSSTNYQGKTVDIPSDVDGISLHVDATNGKLYCVGRNNAQFNSGTILQVPVKSTKDTVEVVAYPNYHNYTIGGTQADADDVKHRATSAEVEQGYVEVVGTGTSYLYLVKVTQVSQVQEKALYTTDFTEWTEIDRKTATNVTDTVTTKYSHENLIFTFNGVGVYPEGTNAKFSSYTGFMETAKYTGEYSAAEPSCVTSPLASITKIVFTQCATGGNRGYKVSVKGDGDSTWVTLFNQSITTSSGETQTLEINRTNCQLKFENFTLSQNAYMTDLVIYGNVDMSTAPALASFQINGTTYQAADIFEENESGEQEATIKISRSQEMISESNPLTNIVTDNGDVTSTTYTTTGTGSEQETTVTIIVEADGTEATYKLHVVYKPLYTITYYNSDNTELGQQQVEEDAAIGSFSFDESNVTVADGSKFRGWVINAETGEKADTTTTITADTTLYALVTPVETANDTARYEYVLTNPYFYAEDHEAFVPEGQCAFHDTTHGWVFKPGDKVYLLMGGKGYVKLNLCQYSSTGDITLTDADGNILDQVDAKASTDGASAILNNASASGTLTLTFVNGGYLHELDIVNLQETPYDQEGQWYKVKAGDADGLVTTLEIVNGNNAATDAPRSYIFLPKGTYDLGSKCLTQISGNNISIIGEDMDNTIIMNTPEQEGIGVTATLLNTSNNLYLGDLTIKNAYPFDQSTGRAVCLQDKGTLTICKHVKMLSYQDTYFSNNNTGQFYFEECDIHGIVDYICGGGEAYFKDSKLTCEAGKSCYITAPYTDGTDYGYVFNNCKVVDLQADRASDNKLYFGRAWGGTAMCTFLNTTLDANAQQHIAEQHWVISGMNVVAKNFFEYGLFDENGNDISLTENVVTFKKDGEEYTYNTILNAEDTVKYSLENVFGDWAPNVKTDTLESAPLSVTFDGNTLNWESQGNPSAFAIYMDDSLLTIEASDVRTLDVSQYNTADTTVSSHTFSVRAFNQIGTYSKSVSVEAVADGITSISNESDTASVEIYSVNGTRQQHLNKGVNIVKTTHADGKVSVEKVIVND